MSIIQYDMGSKEVQYLMSTDGKLKRLISFIESTTIEIEENGLNCIVKYIIGQQISDKTREKIWQKVRSSIGDLSTEVLRNVSNEELQSFGIPRHKISYIRELLNAIDTGEVCIAELYNLSNEEVIRKLTKVKGIGRWTAEMYLIFSLGRKNVVSKGDGTIRRTLQWMYGLSNLPTKKEVGNYFLQWEEYATIVSSYFWSSISLGITNTVFDETIP